MHSHTERKTEAPSSAESTSDELYDQIFALAKKIEKENFSDPNKLSQEYKTVFEMINSALKSGPQLKFLRLKFALQFLSNQFADSLETLELILKDNAKYDWALSYKAKCLWKLKHFQEGVAFCKKGLDIAVKKYFRKEILITQALCEEAVGNFQFAESIYVFLIKKSREKEPQDINEINDFQLKMASMLFNSGKFDKAYSALQSLPSSLVRAVLQGRIAEKLNMLSKAEEYFTLALTFKPESKREQNFYALALVKKRRSEKALTYLTKKGDKTNYLYYFAQAEACFTLGKYDDAEKNYLQSLEHCPSCADANAGLFNVYLKTNRLEPALKEYQSILTVHPDNIEFRKICLEAAEGQADLKIAEVLRKNGEGLSGVLTKYSSITSNFASSSIQSSHKKLNGLFSEEPSVGDEKLKEEKGSVLSSKTVMNFPKSWPGGTVMSESTDDAHAELNDSVSLSQSNLWQSNRTSLKTNKTSTESIPFSPAGKMGLGEGGH